MLLRFLTHSLRNRPKITFLVLLAIVLGSSVATAFLGLSEEIGHKMALELRKYGANIVIEPRMENTLLREDDLPRLKTVFWKYNITGFAPYLFSSVDFTGPAGRGRGILAGTWFSKRLEIPGELATNQGVRIVAPWWQLTGRYPAAPAEAVVGGVLARRLGVGQGGKITVHRDGKSFEAEVVGIVTTGGYEEEQCFLPLVTAQEFLGLPGKVSRVLVSALTVPMDDFGRKDPATMDKREYEKWYCTAYVTSVAKNVEEAMAGSRAKPLWQVAGAEGAVLTRVGRVMNLLTGLALFAAIICVSSSLTAATVQRRREIALMKGIGASGRQIAALYLAETGSLSLCGGLLGYGVGRVIAQVVSRTVFDSGIASPAWLFPTALASAFVVAFAGAVVPLRRALAEDPVRGLRS